MTKRAKTVINIFRQHFSSPESFTNIDLASLLTEHLNRLAALITYQCWASCFDFQWLKMNRSMHLITDWARFFQSQNVKIQWAASRLQFQWCKSRLQNVFNSVQSFNGHKKEHYFDDLTKIHWFYEIFIIEILENYNFCEIQRLSEFIK